MWQAAPDNLIDSQFDETNPVNDSGFGTQTREVCKLNDVTSGENLGSDFCFFGGFFFSLKRFIFNREGLNTLKYQKAEKVPKT